MSRDNVLFELDTIVYCRTDDEVCGVVTGIVYRPIGITYMVTWGIEGEQTHFASELTKEKAFSEKPP